MDMPFRVALDKALGITIGLMAIELWGRTMFDLSLATEIVHGVMRLSPS